MEPFVAQCPQCKARLKVTDPSVLGKRVRCPKCKQVFQVAAPAAGTTPAKPAAGVSPEADFREEASGVTLGRRQTGSAAQSRAAPAPSAKPGSSPGKSRKPLLIGGGIAAAVIVGIVAWLLFPTEPDQPAVPAEKPAEPVAEAPPPAPAAPGLDLAYVPPDAELIVVLRAATLWDSPLVKQLLQMAGPQAQQKIAEMQQKFGLTPADLTSIVIATRDFGEVASAGMQRAMGLGPMGLPPGAGNPAPGATPAEIDDKAIAPGLVVVRTARSYDREKLLALATQHEQLTHQGKTYFHLTGKPGDKPLWVHFANEQTIVAGSEDEVQAALERGDQSAVLPPGLSALNVTHPIVIALMPSEETRQTLKSGAAASPLAGAGATANDDPLSQLLEQHVTTFGISLNVTNTLSGQVILPCDDTQAAAQIVLLFEQQVADAKRSLAGMKQTLPPPFGQIAEDALASVKTSQPKGAIEITAALPASLFEPQTLQQLPMLAMSLMMGGMAPGQSPEASPTTPDSAPK